MGTESLLGYVAAAVSVLVAAFVLWQDRRQRAYWALAAILLVLALREVLGVQAVEAIADDDVLRWHQYRFFAEAFLPGFGLLFALTFARANESWFVKRWWWVLLTAFVLPIGIAGFFRYSLVQRADYSTPNWFVPLGNGGIWLQTVILLGAVVVLTNLEGTLRASSSTFRWQIKLVVIGVGVIFGVQIFLSSQILLYQLVWPDILPFGSAALLLGSVFIGFSLARRTLRSFDVYPSERFVYNSLTLLFVGIYLLAVVFLMRTFRNAWVVAFFVLIAMVGLFLVLLSSELRERARRFINRHLQRPTHDYRGLWDDFTRRTSSVVDVEPLCTEIAKIAAETFGCSAATIWLTPAGDDRLSLGGSSAISADQAFTMLKEHAEGRGWREVLETGRENVLDLASDRLPDSARELVRAVNARYAVALSGSDGETIGYLTVNDRITGQAYTTEDFALLETLADQAAAAISNRQLTRDLQRAKQMETFQALSTFFIHDLKNLASRLSLVLQNLPAHYDKPAFREDLLSAMEKSVRKIDTMTSRLSSLSKGLELQRVETDLNAFVKETLDGLNGALRATLSSDLQEIPTVSFDPEQIQKVVTNLVLNANEAVGDKGNEGEVLVRTSRESGWVLLSVADNGCGMSPEFVAKSLFRPFQTTKKQGLGIGLFHTKTIVEAHGGRIEVESAEGEGTTFRVFLPSGRELRPNRRGK